MSGTSQRELVYLCPLRANGIEPPLYCFPGAGGEVGIFERMVSMLPEGRPIYAINCANFFKARTSFAIEQLADLCLRTIVQNQQHGPYYLCGYSLGGLLAYETAAHLANEGHDIGLLALFDTPNPAFAAGLSGVEAAQFRKRYLLDRLKKYGRYLRSGDFDEVVKGALLFLSASSEKFPLLFRSVVRLSKAPVPAILQNNDFMYAAALRAYRPRPYQKRLLLFCTENYKSEYAMDLTRGWGRYATGGTDVYIVPGGHISILDSWQLVNHLASSLDGRGA
jgi:thioesterase domain-containing protein